MRRTSRIVHDHEGLNTGEWPLAVAEHFITPVDKFFTRSHSSIPEIDPATFRLEIGGLVRRPRSYRLAELEREFGTRNVTATLVCAGLRRDEYLAARPVPGELPWGSEPVSTGEWSGIPLEPVLDAAGVDPEARHVELIGLDQVERGGARFGFGGSVRLDKAREGSGLLALRLNGAPLPPAHGFPLRAVIPGWIGARSVKWLGRINLLAEPSSNYFQSRAYRVQREVDHLDPRDVSAGTAMNSVPLNAVITDPAPGQGVPSGPVRVRGWAMGGAGQPLERVECSPDGGVSWARARITRDGAPWSWSLWEVEVRLAPGTHILLARATDRSGAAQPPTVLETWNVKGYGNNAWHRVPVTVTP